MPITVIKPGILTTVQDLGRIGHARSGINRNGVMDASAARVGNIILGNTDTDAVLEVHFPAAELRFERDALISVCGADFSPLLDNIRIENWRPQLASQGSVLRFSKKRRGNRAYVAVRGGFEADEWLGSRSSNQIANAGGFGGRRILAGDRLEFLDRSVKLPDETPRVFVSASLIPRYSAFPTVRVTRGAEFERVSPHSQAQFLNESFVISPNSNRMGFRLSGNGLEITGSREIVSSAVGFGTIQRLPDGQLIILMADHQTSGGYPRIAHIVPNDLPLAAQLGANDKIAFHEISTRDAEELVVGLERDLNKLRTACSFLYK